MTTWTLCPATAQYAADLPLNAAIARTYLQDNLLTCVEQSGHDLSCMVSDGAASMTVAVTTDWAWATEWVPELVPIYQKHGGGWRTMTIGVFASHASDFDLRVFLLDTPRAPEIDAGTGDVVGVTSYVELKYTSGSYEWQEDDVAPEGYTWISPEGITPTIEMPVVYVHLAARISSGTGNLAVRDMRISEAY